MSALDHSSLLEQLIISGELAIQMRSTREPAALLELAKSVQIEFAAPVDGVRVIDADTMIFATALVEAATCLRSHNRARATRYLRIVGVLMPEIREALSLAIEQRKRPTA